MLKVKEGADLTKYGFCKRLDFSIDDSLAAKHQPEYFKMVEENDDFSSCGSAIHISSEGLISITRYSRKKECKEVLDLLYDMIKDGVIIKESEPNGGLPF